jgi:Flp pilus assembly protein TadB
VTIVPNRTVGIAEAERRQRAARRRNARSARLRSLRARLLPRRRRVARLTGRRNRAQFAGIAVGLIVVLSLTWYLVDAWPVRIAVFILALLALPALVTLTLDRRTR